jgi:hypothetical protein
MVLVEILYGIGIRGHHQPTGIFYCLPSTLSIHSRIVDFQELGQEYRSADMGIRTPVAGVRVLHDWPDYTISAGNAAHDVPLYFGQYS